MKVRSSWIAIALLVLVVLLAWNLGCDLVQHACPVCG